MRVTRMTPEQRARLAMWREYGATIERLAAALPLDAKEWPMQQIADAVIGACRGMGYGPWQELDERAGYRDLAWRFALVRQVRNSPQHGPALIAAINAPKQRTTKATTTEQRA